MAEIVLATFNARFIHPSLALRSLLANLGPLAARARLLEFDLGRRTHDAAEDILAQYPRVLGLSVQIWNVEPSTALITLLKRLRPALRIVLGGPEADAAAPADHIVRGEGELAFADLCRRLLAPAADTPPPFVIEGGRPDPAALAFPYDLYTDDDLAHRLVYVEASRGCPFHCEFCLSSIEPGVRRFPAPAFLEQLKRLLARGAKKIKFVDRTFNLENGFALAIAELCLEHSRPDLCCHFEIVPDRLSPELAHAFARFPPGALRLEAGVQTFDPDVAARVGRTQDSGRVERTLRWLLSHTGAIVHADLIAGLPGETLEGFGAGFDRLHALGPHEIQIGILKRLRGTAIGRHDAEWGMIYNPNPPYDLLENRLLDFATVARLRRLARAWQLVGNSRRFTHTLPLLWAGGASPFHTLWEFAEWLHRREGRLSAISLHRLAALLKEHLVTQRAQPAPTIDSCLAADWRAAGKPDPPPCVG